MKIWQGYGSEHSSNIVLIGTFKSDEDAQKTQQTIEQLIEGLRDKIEIGENRERYGSDIRKLLGEVSCYILSPTDLEHFLYDTSTKVENNKIVLSTEEYDVAGYIKLMIQNGAKIEMYSAHDYPNEED